MLIGLELRIFQASLGKPTFGAAGDWVGKHVFMDFIKCSLCKNPRSGTVKNAEWLKCGTEVASEKAVCSVVRLLGKRTWGSNFSFGSRSQTDLQAEGPHLHHVEV